MTDSFQSARSSFTRVGEILVHEGLRLQNEGLESLKPFKRFTSLFQAGT